MAKKSARSGARATTHARRHTPTTPVEAPTTPIDVSAPSGFLIAIELGGEWPSLAMHGCERRVLAQHEGETPAAFADRVTKNLDALFGRGVELSRVALACNERIDAAADEARRTLLGLSLGAMAPRHAGQLLLTAAPRSSDRLRRYLTALAADSGAEWQSAGLEVSTDFGREAPAAIAPRARVA